MAHLKNSGTGHLVHTVTGHLAKCGTCCDGFLPTQVTLSGLTGAFATYNGTYAVTGAGCTKVYDDYTAPVSSCTGTKDCSYLDGAGTTFDVWEYLSGIRIEVEQSNVSGVDEGRILVKFYAIYYEKAVSGPGAGPTCFGPYDRSTVLEDDPITPCLDDSTTYSIPFKSSGSGTKCSTHPTTVDVDLS